MLQNIPWQGLVLGGALINAVGSSLSKYQVNRASSFQVLIYKYISSALLMTGIWWLSGNPVPKLWWLLTIYGGVGAVSVAAMTAALRHSLSQSTLMMPINRLLGVMWSGILLGEFYLFNLETHSGRLALVAVLLIPVIFWLFYEKKSEVKRWNKLIWGYIVWSSVVPAVAKLFLATAEPVTVLVFMYWGGLMSALVFSWWRYHKLYIDKRFAVVGLAHGLINSVGVLFWITAISLTTATQAILLRLPIFVLLTTISGLFVFKERFSLTKRKIAGMGVALVLLVIVLLISR